MMIPRSDFMALPSAQVGIALRLKMVNADGTAACSSLVHDGQARRAMLEEFASRVVKRRLGFTTGRRGPHDLFDSDFGSAVVVSRHTAAHVALGDDADQLEILRAFNYRRAAAA